jgi:hypothetical protein
MADKKGQPMMEEKCEFWSGIIAYESYTEIIGGTKTAFHAEACTDAYKNKLTSPNPGTNL